MLAPIIFFTTLDINKQRMTKIEEDKCEKKEEVKEGGAAFYAFAFFPLFFPFPFTSRAFRGGLAKLINVNLLT